MNEVGLDATVFAFATLLTLATGVVFGLVPALQSSRTDVAHALNDAPRGGSGVAGRAVRRTLVVGEIALALMLLTGAPYCCRRSCACSRPTLDSIPRTSWWGS